MKTLCCDVGSGSVRVAIIEYTQGNVLQTKPIAISTEPLQIYNPQTDFYEQKSSEIWAAFCKCTRECIKQAEIGSVDSVGSFPIDSIAFSATCSLVIVDDNKDDLKGDVIMWMDHRAIEEAEIINKTGNQVLTQFGGTCSPEFSLSKLFWLYRNDSTRFTKAKAFMELSDWLTYRCSDLLSSPELFPRSLCTVTCKWGYDAQKGEWRADLFEQIGMNLNDNDLRNKIGNSVAIPGIRVASLSVGAAKEIGFEFVKKPESRTIESVSLASSLIDAHAGMLSMLVYGNLLTGTQDQNGDLFENVFCMISGTSTCHMVLNQNRTFTKGVWGPYADAIVPGYFLREAGQSATGKLIEHVIKSNYGESEIDSLNISDKILEFNQELKAKNFDYRTSLVVNPTFHGNRSPIANPNLKGAIYGFTLERTTLLDLYAATVEAIAYETKFIIEQLEKNSEPIKKLIATGGLVKNDFYLQVHSDILGLEVITFSAGEADLMLVGASVIALTASEISVNDDGAKEKMLKLLKTLKTDSNGFAESVRVFRPRESTKEYHAKKYQCYRALLDCSLKIENLFNMI